MTEINETEINGEDIPIYKDPEIDIKAVISAIIRGHKQTIALLEKLLAA